MKLLLPLVLVMCACGVAPSTDAGSVVDSGFDAGSVDGGLDAGVDGGVDGGLATSLVASFGARSAPFDRAQHGLEPDGGLYVEAHFGGDPACPNSNSPTPDRTLIISGLRSLTDGGSLSEADGLRVTLLDFSGALTALPFVRATRATASALEVRPGVSVSFSVAASFDGGSLSGSFSAPHCASLDGP